jgi:hypothetical protein
MRETQEDLLGARRTFEDDVVRGFDDEVGKELGAARLAGVRT